MDSMEYFPEPDILYRPHLEAMTAPQPKALRPEVKNIRMGLEDVFVKKNKDLLNAEIVLATVVTDNLSEEPIVLNLQKFEGVGDDIRLGLGPAGVAMYRNREEGAIPRFIDYRILVFDSDEDSRNVGQLIAEIQADQQFISAKDKLVAAITTANPTIGIAIEAVNIVIGVIARVLKMNKDDQFIYITGSFDNAFDNLGTIYGPVIRENYNARVAYEVRVV